MFLVLIVDLWHTSPLWGYMSWQGLLGRAKSQPTTTFCLPRVQHWMLIISDPQWTRMEACNYKGTGCYSPIFLTLSHHRSPFPPLNQPPCESFRQIWMSASVQKGFEQELSMHVIQRWGETQNKTSSHHHPERFYLIWAYCGAVPNSADQPRRFTDPLTPVCAETWYLSVIV